MFFSIMVYTQTILEITYINFVGNSIVHIQSSSGVLLLSLPMLINSIPKFISLRFDFWAQA